MKFLFNVFISDMTNFEMVYPDFSLRLQP